MHRSLILLARLRLRGQWRLMKRSLASPKGILLALVTLTFFGTLLVPYLLTRNLPRDAERELRPFLSWYAHPAALLMLWCFSFVAGLFKSPIAFSMGEVDFLFPGPFSRRQLLAYKLASSSVGTLGVSLITPLFLPLTWWPAALAGFWLTLSFMQWTSILVALASGWIGMRFRRLRWALVALLPLAAGISFWQAGALARDLGFRERLAALESSWALQAAMTPFVPFSSLISAANLATLAGWGAGALAIVLVVAALIVRLDAHFLEASLEASRRRYDMQQRLKRTGGMPALTASPRLALPRLPRWRGIGSIAWRQATELLRRSGMLIYMLLAIVGPFSALAIISIRHHTQPPVGLVVGITLSIGMLVSMIMPLGLRTDVNHMDVIKTLPIGPKSIVWGSIGVAIAYITALQIVANVAIAILMGGWTRGASLAMALAPPVNLLLVGSDSALVLMFPSIRHFSQGDVFAGIRIVLVNLAKVGVALVAGGLAGAAALLAQWLTHSPVIATAAGCGMLLLVGLASVMLAAVVFEHFDPSAHVAEGD